MLYVDRIRRRLVHRRRPTGIERAVGELLPDVPAIDGRRRRPRRRPHRRDRRAADSRRAGSAAVERRNSCSGLRQCRRLSRRSLSLTLWIEARPGAEIGRRRRACSDARALRAQAFDPVWRRSRSSSSKTSRWSLLARPAASRRHTFADRSQSRTRALSAFDPVTNADRAIERVLRSAIVARYPQHGIVAEEEGERVGAGEYTWFIDPIDGTRAFMTGSPLWGTLIGLTQRALGDYQGRPLFGLLAQPVLEEVFFGGPSGELAHQGRAPRSPARPRRARRSRRPCSPSTHPDMFDGERAAAFRALVRAVLADSLRRRLLQLCDVGGGISSISSSRAS